MVYDSNCKVCTSLRDIILKLTSIPRAQISAFKDLDSKLSRHVDGDRFRNAMALIDTSGGETLYGAEGVAYVFSSQYRIVDFILRFRACRLVFGFFYKTLAYNRYIIATPRSAFACDCFPDKVVGYRLSYIALTTSIAIFLSALFGLALAGFSPGLLPDAPALQMILVTGTGWVLQIALALMVMKGQALDYIGHLGSIMVAGVLILVPGMLLSATGATSIYIPLLSVLLSSGWMLYLHVHRVHALRLSQAWTVSWFALLQATAIFWIWFFHHNDKL